MPRFALLPLVLFAFAFAAAAGCNNGRSRDLGMRSPAPETLDSATPDPDGGTTPDGGEADGAIDVMPTGCDDGFTECGGTCVDADNDDRNCGGCDIACTGGFCEMGFCVEDGPTCPSPRMMCGESCVDTQTNSAHCGACFDGCASGEACRAGGCVSTCTPSCGGASCGNDGCGGICGTCGSDTTCVSGRCDPITTGTAGETCATASPIFSSTTFTFSGRTAEHTPFSCGATSARPDAAYLYTAISGGSVTVTASGASGADTMVSVYSGSSCSSSVEVGCNDDSPTSGGYDSELTFTATALRTYYIVVAPYSATTPTETITLTVRPTP